MVHNANQAQLAAYQAQLQQYGAGLGGLFGIPSTIMGAAPNTFAGRVGSGLAGMLGLGGA
jgi:hypothetical protein